MSELILYNNQMWKLKYEFTNTGTLQEIPLNAGTYLLSCFGACGGKGYSEYANKQPGGTAYGILDIDEPVSLYAVVGRDGLNTSLYSFLTYDNSGYTGNLTPEMFDVVSSKEIFIGHENEWGNFAFTDNVGTSYINWSQTVSNNLNQGYVYKRKARFASITAYHTNGDILTFTTNLLSGNTTYTRYGDVGENVSGSIVYLYQEPANIAFQLLHHIPNESTEVGTRTALSPSEVASVVLTWYELKPEYEYMIPSFNGGALGGVRKPGTVCYHGAGGGGATDIRTVNSYGEQPIGIKTFEVPEGYQEIEYIEMDESTHASWIDTEYIHKSSTKFECYNNTSNATSVGFSTMYGARNNTYNYNAFVLFTSWIHASSTACYSRTGNETPFSDFVYNTDICIETYGNTIDIYNNDKSQLLTTHTIAGTNNSGVCNMVIGNLNISTGVNTSIYGPDTQYTGKIYAFKIYEDDELLHYFVPARHVDDLYTITLHSEDFEQGTIIQSGDTTDSTRIRTLRFFNAGDFKGDITFEGYDKNGNPLSLCISEYYTNNRSAIINAGAWVSPGSSTAYTSQYTNQIRFILKIDDSTNIAPTDLDYITITVSNCNAGLFDILEQKFYASHVLSTDFGRGNDVPDENKTRYSTQVYKDLGSYSRILVAGGGGGASNITSLSSYSLYSGFGGGALGGPVSSYYSDPNNGLYASQTDGYEFGHGMQPPTKTANAHGAGGGGGGWYGGYSSDMLNSGYSSSNGGGGSGYAFTESSYKPDPSLAPDSKFYLRNVSLSNAPSHNAAVRVYEPVSSINAGDIITVPVTGTKQSYFFPGGIYNIKCYGGDGGTYGTVPRGGYSQGTIKPEIPVTMIFAVGGSSVYNHSPLDVLDTMAPFAGYNGGGRGETNAGNFLRSCSTFGGGASDVRINTDSLYARVIVAGGGGGTGYYAGGNGGGETGGYSNNTSTSDNYPGPGTQTSSPTSQSYPAISGSFGQGGGGLMNSTTGFGGAGGGGWYGGAGARAGSSTADNGNNRGGSGGSGYVYTESSYKPEGYLIEDPSLYMESATTILGGNDLPYGVTKIQVTVVEVGSLVQMLCGDSEGYKYYDNENHRWTLLETQSLTPENFMTYGSYVMNSDEGLLESYSIYCYDEDDVVGGIVINVVPNKQIIKYHTRQYLSPINVTVDVDDYDTSVNKIDVSYDLDTTKKTEVIIDVDKHSSDTISIYGFNIEYGAKDPTLHSRYVAPKTPIIPKRQWLLTVGSKLPFAAHYNTHYLSPIGGTTAITSIYGVSTLMYDRSLICALILNGTHIRLISVNIRTSFTEVIAEYPISTFDNNAYCVKILMDENYIYLTNFNASVYIRYPKIFMISRQNTSVITSYTAPGEYMIASYGKMMWLSDHEIINVEGNRFLIFNTLRKEFKIVAAPGASYDASIYDFEISDKYFIAMAYNKLYVYDRENETWLSQISFSSRNANNGIAHGDGYFYLVTDYGYIYKYDDKTMEQVSYRALDQFDVAGVFYTKGLLYIMLANNTKGYVYDINNDTYDVWTFPWTIPYNYYSRRNGAYAFDKNLFVPDRSLGDISYNSDIKYLFGPKINEENFYTDLSNISNIEYDERFVTLTSSCMKVKDGDIEKPVSGTTIKVANINKQEYNKFNKLKLIKKEDEEEHEDEPV